MSDEPEMSMPEHVGEDNCGPDETQSALDAIEKLIGAKLSSSAPSPPVDKSAFTEEKSDSEA